MKAALFLTLLAVCWGGCNSAEPIQLEPSTIELLERPQRDDDLLPPFLRLRFEPETTRLIDNRNNRTYWAAYSTEGEICLIIGFNVDRPDRVVGSSCVSETILTKHGLSVSVQGENHYSQAIFVPDGYTQALMSQFEGSYVVTNMVAFDSVTAAAAAFEAGSITLRADDDKTADLILFYEP